MFKWILFFTLMISLVSTVEAHEADKQKMPLPLGKDISERFTGTVHRHDLIVADDAYKVPQTNVITFEPGSYSGWHTHGAMTVIGVAGLGIYQEWGKEPVLIKPGDVVQIPAGVSHFHGAVKDSPFQQFVVYDKDWQPQAGAKAHSGPVSAQEYNSIKFSAAKSQAAALDSSFAHIAINPQDNHEVSWYDFPTAEYAAIPFN